MRSGSWPAQRAATSQNWLPDSSRPPSRPREACSDRVPEEADVGSLLAGGGHVREQLALQRRHEEVDRHDRSNHHEPARRRDQAQRRRDPDEDEEPHRRHRKHGQLLRQDRHPERKRREPHSGEAESRAEEQGERREQPHRGQVVEENPPVVIDSVGRERVRDGRGEGKGDTAREALADDINEAGRDDLDHQHEASCGLDRRPEGVEAAAHYAPRGHLKPPKRRVIVEVGVWSERALVHDGPRLRDVNSFVVLVVRKVAHARHGQAPRWPGSRRRRVSRRPRAGTAGHAQGTRGPART